MTTRRRARRPMNADVWKKGAEPAVTQVSASLYGNLAARLWSAGPADGHHLYVWLSEGHRTSFDPVGLIQLTGTIDAWQRLHALLTEALDAHEAEMRAVEVEDQQSEADRS